VALVSVARVTAAVGIGDCVSVAYQCKAIQTLLSSCHASNDSIAEIESFFEDTSPRNCDHHDHLT
jgi:hypothetical protein